MEGNNLLKDTNSFKLSVSSVLDDDAKQNGKQFLVDDQPDTAWMSKDGAFQWVNIIFEEEQEVGSFCLQFQGGFHAASVQARFISPKGNYHEFFEPEDINSEQIFQLKNRQKNVKVIRFMFSEGSDLFGRIILYKLQVFS